MGGAESTGDTKKDDMRGTQTRDSGANLAAAVQPTEGGGQVGQPSEPASTSQKFSLLATALRTTYMLIAAAEVAETGTFMIHGGVVLMAAGGPAGVGVGTGVVLVGGALNVLGVAIAVEGVFSGSVSGRLGY